MLNLGDLAVKLHYAWLTLSNLAENDRAIAAARDDVGNVIRELWSEAKAAGREAQI